MNSNQLLEHVRELNKRERQEHELKKIKALNKIKELRQKIKREQDARTTIPQ